MSQMHLWEEHESGYLSFWYISPSKTVTTTTIEDVVRRIVSLKLWNWSSSSLVSGFGSTSAFNRNRTGLRDCRRSKENHISQGTIKREKEWARGKLYLSVFEACVLQGLEASIFRSSAVILQKVVWSNHTRKKKKVKKWFRCRGVFCFDWLID